MNLTDPPENLGAAGTRLWSRVLETFELRPDECEMLELACMCVDRAQAARYTVDLDGLLVPGKYGPKQNPALAIERGAIQLYSRLLRQLGLPTGWPAGIISTSRPAPVVLQPPKKKRGA